MDGENNGKPYEQMDDLGVPQNPYFWFNTQISKTQHHQGNPSCPQSYLPQE